MTDAVLVKYRPHPKTATKAPITGTLYAREENGIRVRVVVISKARYVLVPFERIISVGGDTSEDAIQGRSADVLR